MTCPRCGANMVYEKNMKVCNYCGYKEKDTSALKDYNLLIVCPPEPAGPVRIEIADSKIAFDTRPGESRGFKLAPGPHYVNFIAGNKRSKRLIYTLDGGDPVNIAVSYDAVSEDSVYLRIEQPDTEGEFPPLNNGKLPPSESKLSFAALILSMTFIGSFPAVIMALIDIAESKHQNREINLTSVFAIIFGAVFTLTILVIIFGDG